MKNKYKITYNAPAILTFAIISIIALILYLGQEIVNGFISIDNVSQFAHIIGGFAGAFFGFFDKNAK